MPGSLRMLAAAALGCLVLLGGCDSSTGPDHPPDRIEALPRSLSVSEREVIARSNTFAFGLLREVYKREVSPNVFISPLSASMALGMTLNGAANATFDSMRIALGLQGMSQDDINKSYHDLTELLLKLDPRVELSIANSTWARNGFPIKPSFVDAVTTWFGAEAAELDFTSPSAVTAINGWAAEHTKDRIKQVIDRIESHMILFLLNAVYFKGDWTDRFDASRTQPSPFRLANGQTVQVSTMHGKVKAGLTWRPGVVVGELPYGGQAFVLTIVMPEENAKLADVIAGLTPGKWAEWTSGLPAGDYGKVTAIEVALPKLELEYETKLNDALTALGMGIAFDDQRADFSRLTPVPQVYIDFVKQNTFLKMDEKGTEAAAVTTVGMGLTSLPPGLTVDRPYLFAIRERLSGTILFMGAIGDPR